MPKDRLATDLGLMEVFSLRRVPKPPAKSTTFMGLNLIVDKKDLACRLLGHRNKPKLCDDYMKFKDTQNDL